MGQQKRVTTDYTAIMALPLRSELQILKHNELELLMFANTQKSDYIRKC